MVMVNENRRIICMTEEQNLEQSIRETFSDIIEAGENILIQELIRTREAAYSMWTYKTDKLRTKVQMILLKFCIQYTWFGLK